VFSYREVKHENIITYYGCALQQSGRARKNVHWIMIMEYCDDTLKSKSDMPCKCVEGWSIYTGKN